MFNKYFQLEEKQTKIKQEIIAGATTFLTMSYIIIVNPKILEAAGIPFGPSMVATVLSAFFGTMIMGLYAKRPFAIAPYMGENAFIAFTVVQVLGYSWQTALGAIFIYTFNPYEDKKLACQFDSRKLKNRICNWYRFIHYFHRFKSNRNC